MNETDRAVVLICQLLEAAGVLDKKSPAALELRALYLTLLRRSESAADYHSRPRGRDNMRALELDKVKEHFPTKPPTPLPQQTENR